MCTLYIVLNVSSPRGNLLTVLGDLAGQFVHKTLAGIVKHLVKPVEIFWGVFKLADIVLYNEIAEVCFCFSSVLSKVVILPILRKKTMTLTILFFPSALNLGVKRILTCLDFVVCKEYSGNISYKK